MRRWAPLLVVVLVLLAAGLLPMLAFGQASAPQRTDACTGQPIPPDVQTAVDFDLTQPLAECRDWRLGSFRVNAHGIVEWDYCKNPATGRYYVRRVVTTRADIEAAPGIVVDAVLAGWPREITAEDRLRLGRKYAHLVKPMGHPENAAVWCPFRQAMIDGAPSASAPSPWIVAKNGVLTTRPTYPVVSGRRSTRSNGNVPVGADCDMTGAIVEPPFNFGYPNGGPPSSVTLCVRR